MAFQLKSRDVALRQAHEDNATLREDISCMGRMLGEAIRKHSGEEVFHKGDHLRRLAREWREGDASALHKLNEEVSSFSIDELVAVAREFAIFLALANTAETHHKVRMLRKELGVSSTGPTSSSGEVSMTQQNGHGHVDGGMNGGTGHDETYEEPLPVPRRINTSLGSIEHLLRDKQVSPEEIFKAITTQHIELVLTAHPTEVNRRTFLNKQKIMARDLEKLSFYAMTPYEQHEVMQSLKREITSVWNSDIVRYTKPTPIDEAGGGLAIVEQVLWDAVPAYLRKLDTAMQLALKQRLPIDAAPIRFASWMGGDRDGNPNVTPDTTRTVSLMGRWQAMTLLIKDIKDLKMTLSSTLVSEELRAAVGQDCREPYRALMVDLEREAEATLQAITTYFAPAPRMLLRSDPPKLPISRTSQVLDRLMLLYRSLLETGQDEMANGLLTDTIRRLKTFGVTLLPLDVRQESTVHTATLDAITRYLGIGSYAQWDERTRESWLMAQLNTKRPLLHKELPLSSEEFGFSAQVVDCLETFRMIAELEEEVFGAYVISMSTAPSDVLAVKLLMKEFGLKRNMRVVPLFETLDDLKQSAETMETLFSNVWYKGHINGKQEIMIGYSDSSKDAGRLAAIWSQYEAQERLAALAKKHGIELTFFHGKGGTVSRGGNPSMYQAIISQPPDTLNGRFRVTEQGEMIQQNYGHKAVAEATLDLYTAGVLAERFQKAVQPPKEWRDVMDKLSRLGCESYRATVRGDPRFVPYFRAATPEPELGTANIGSRPQKRRPGGVETLRAIPWVFSWTQTRLHLSAWLGVGEALEAVLESDDAKTLRDMYASWPFFNTNIDLVDMILAKADLDIAGNYDRLLVTDPEQKQLGEELRARLKSTTKAVLQLAGHDRLQQDNPVLQWSIMLRNTYVDPLNVLQAHVLRRLRNAEYKDESERIHLADSLVVTINGISAGMRNTG